MPKKADAIVESRPLPQRAYEELQRGLRLQGAADGAPWEQLSPTERATWNARCRATIFIIEETVGRLMNEAIRRGRNG